MKNLIFLISLLSEEELQKLLLIFPSDQMEKEAHWNREIKSQWTGSISMNGISYFNLKYIPINKGHERPFSLNLIIGKLMGNECRFWKKHQRTSIEEATNPQSIA